MELKKYSTLINMTKYHLKVLHDGKFYDFQPGDLTTDGVKKTVLAGEFNGIPIYQHTQYAEDIINILPEYHEGQLIIVTRGIALAAQHSGRRIDDLVIPENLSTEDPAPGYALCTGLMFA